ncbi:MAG: penicillin-binding protein 1C [Bacteroidetes bacterium]|nr:penicillin-binding protein 1C [Bacteroidota bacterium]
MKVLNFGLKWKWYFWFAPALLLYLLLLLAWPRHLFNDPASTVAYDSEMRLLGAKISADQQWRFPESTDVPEKFRKAIICYEDQWFPFHPGFNPVSMARAVVLNLKHHKIVSGGSTISMQLIRLARKNRERTYFEKVIEISLAFILELTHSKKEILRLYASHAPFGGNVIGVEAASWRYFGVSANRLSWAEAATLAVLPNSPGLIYPGRSPRNLLIKRNRLLDKLWSQGRIDLTTCELAKSEPLPVRPYPLPRLAPHLLDRLAKEGFKGEKVQTTLDARLQERVNNILELHGIQLAANEIHNAAAIVVDVNTGNVLAYSGNLHRIGKTDRGNDVDVIISPRSTGSILKPFLYAAMLNDALILPNTLIPDIPVQIGGFIPENYNLTYDGAVPAKRALSRSLNIPAVKMLQTYGYTPFYNLLKNVGLTTLTRPADHYGLAIILGGAEARLWDLAGMYASMARTLKHFSPEHLGYNKADFHPPVFIHDGSSKVVAYESHSSWYDAASIWLTFEAMVEVARPDEEAQWQQFSSSHKIAWKTGTSFGNRDAWSVGITPEYVVAVWVGNASGEGRPGLTGIGVAAPILFDIFKTLPATSWFRTPVEEMVKIPVCRYSGYRASLICEFKDSVWVQKSGLKTPACPFHQLIHLDKTGQYQVNSGCESTDNMQHVSWFILPPVQEWYFRTKNPFYRMLPPYRKDCAQSPGNRNMDLIYPKDGSMIYVPVDLDGKTGSAVFKAAHHNPDAVINWHLDEQFIGSTKLTHQMALSPERGFHRLTLVDQFGESISIGFEILTKEKNTTSSGKNL